MGLHVFVCVCVCAINLVYNLEKKKLPPLAKFRQRNCKLFFYAKSKYRSKLYFQLIEMVMYQFDFVLYFLIKEPKGNNEISKQSGAILTVNVKLL